MIRKFRHDEGGATAVEFALTLPILLMMLFAIMQFGIFFLASATLQHMLGEGARFAILFPTPNDQQIIQKMAQSRYTTSLVNFNVSVTPTATTRNLTASFTMTPWVPFYQFSPITVTKSKLVYLSI